MKIIPVAFLLGAGRSGTTLLYKILCSHPAIGYLGNYQSRFPSRPWTAVLHRLPAHFSLLKRRFWFDDEGGAYFNERRKLLNSLVPTPAEAESVYASAGVPLVSGADFLPSAEVVARLRDRFEKVRLASGTKVLLSKRTANNRRVSVIRSIFPEARYIHLVRDGRSVAHSLLKVRWWDDHTLYWSGRTPRQMVEQGSDPLELAARNWAEEMASLEQGIRLIAPEYLLEVRYERLLADARGELERMIDFLGVASVQAKEFWKIVESLGLAAKPESWRTTWDESDRALVTRLQAPTLSRWGFPVETELRGYSAPRSGSAAGEMKR
jgi:omega-hydroxy-beta-dihydromenaquinone-9 sulfotransferase